jgi:Mg2+ and Co2+ transporter CorA
MELSDAINALEYLISDDCTDTPMDYVEEIEMAIDALKHGQVEEEAPEYEDDALKNAFDTLGGMMLRASNYDPDYIETDDEAIGLVETRIRQLERQVDVLKKTLDVVAQSMQRAAETSNEAMAVAARYFLAQVNAAKDRYVNGLDSAQEEDDD